LTVKERRLLFVTSFGHFMSHYNMLVFPAIVLPLASVMNLDMVDVLGLSFMQYLLFGLMALPWGLVGDRLGGKGLTILMFLGSGMCGLAAAAFMTSPDRLSLALAGVGLFSAIYHPIGLGLISKGVERVSVGMGYNAIFGGMGLAVAPLITGIAVWISGPRLALLVLGTLNLAGIGLLLLLPFEEPSVKQEEVSEGGNGMLGAFLILLIAMMLGGIAYTGSSVILPSYLQLKGTGMVEVFSGMLGTNLSGNLVASALTTVVFVVGMLGQYVGGHVGERFEKRYAYLTFHSMCIPAAFLMAFTQNFLLVGIASIYFFFQLGMQAIENTLVADYTPRRLHHSAYGVKFVLTFGVGALAVKMIQFIDSTWGIEAVFTALGIVSVLIVTTIIFLIRQTNRVSVEKCGTVNGVLTAN